MACEQIIYILVLTIFGVHGITLTTKYWIQGKQGSFTCTDSDEVKLRLNGTEITRCLTGANDICDSPLPYFTTTVDGATDTVTFTIISVIRTRDTGTWSCDNDGAYVIDVKVEVKPSLEILMSIIDSENVKFTCEMVDGFPSVLDDGFTWEKDGTVVAGETNSTIYQAVTLNITNYVCTGNNGVGTGQSPLINVNKDIDILNFKPFVQTQYIQDREELKLTYVVEEANPLVPTTNFIWEKDGSVIIGETTSTIDLAKTSDSGAYVCSGDNGVRIAKTSSVNVNIPYECRGKLFILIIILLTLNVVFLATTAISFNCNGQLWIWLKLLIISLFCICSCIYLLYAVFDPVAECRFTKGWALQMCGFIVVFLAQLISLYPIYKKINHKYGVIIVMCLAVSLIGATLAAAVILIMTLMKQRTDTPDKPDKVGKVAAVGGIGTRQLPTPGKDKKRDKVADVESKTHEQETATGNNNTTRNSKKKHKAAVAKTDAGKNNTTDVESGNVAPKSVM